MVVLNIEEMTTLMNHSANLDEMRIHIEVLDKAETEIMTLSFPWSQKNKLFYEYVRNYINDIKEGE